MRWRVPVMGLRTRLLLVGLLALAPGLVAIRYLQGVQRTKARERMVDEGRRTASLAADRLGDDVADALTALASVATLPAVRGSNRKACTEVLDAELVANQSLLNLVVINEDGSIQCATAYTGARSFTTRPAWLERAFQTGHGVIDGNDMYSLSVVPSIVAARPFADSVGRISKVIATAVRLSSLPGAVLPKQLPLGATLTVFNRRGVILGRYPAGGSWIGRRLPPSPLRDSLYRGAPSVTEEQLGVDSVKRIYTSEPLVAPVATGLFIGLGTDEALALADADRLVRLYDLLVILVAIGSIVAATGGAHFFVLRPARVLQSVAARLATGDFMARVDLQRLSGLDDLARAMNGMADALATRRIKQDDAERELRKSEDRYRTLFDMNPYPMWVYDRETLAFLEVNRAAVNRYGYTRAEFLAMTIMDIRPTEDIPPLRVMIDQERDEWVPSGTWRHLLKSGELVDVEISSHPFSFEGRPAALVATRDVTDRARAEAELRKTQDRMRFALEAAGVGLWEATVSPRETTWSPTLEAMHGLGIRGFAGTMHAFLATIHPEDRERVYRVHRGAVREGAEINYEYRTLWPNGTVRLIRAMGQVFRDAFGNATRVAGVAMDITEEQAMEDKLRQSQRMEAVGQLAGGIAHDFNNLLMVIDGNTDMAMRALDRGSAVRKDLQEVRQAATKATKLTSQLLAFSRKQTLMSQALDLDTLVGGVAPLVRRLIGEDIEVRLELGAGGAMTVADPSQLEQAILNLAINSRDAMPRGGILTIMTSAASLSRADVDGKHLELEPGHYVSIVVKDTGCGMDEQTLARAFEPFFTTKEVGRGTGLGLASVYGTVKQSGGHVSAESVVGLGTAFTIFLPRVLDADLIDVQPPVTPTSAARVEHKTILLVEDERAVRELIARVLLSTGYHVIAADSGAEAIERAERHQGKIDLVISDVVMPGVPVTSMIDVLRARRPELAVLLMSGYPDGEIARRGLPTDKYPLLEKPVAAEALLEAIARTLHPPKHARDAVA